MRSGVRSPSAPPNLTTRLNKSSGLNKLSGFLDRDPDRFVIVPWNHHIQWTKSETYNDVKEVTEAPELAGRNSLAAMGRIEQNTYQTLANELKWGDDPKGWDLRLLAIHHRPGLTENVKGPSGYSFRIGKKGALILVL